MTLNEFKYWLDGFSAQIKDTPTPKEWAIILEKLNSALATETEFNKVDANKADANKAWEKAFQDREKNFYSWIDGRK